MGELIEKTDDARLSDRQRRLIDCLSNGENPQTLAEYSGSGDVARATASPLVQAELKARRVAKLRGELAQKALQAMEDLITNEKTPAATRFSAAKWIMEQAGHVASDGEDKDKPLAEMTEAELQAFIQKTEKAMREGGSAPIITVAPHNGA